ncbi:MAG: hypothetical protein HQ594_01830 [Candidatus Omnitrophica bacterium]|nr:hypothetical protein [Candidatus Omnitrophota bacterium]
MIKLDISMALFFYLFFSVVFILIAWSFFDLGTKLKTFSSDERYIWHCSICAHTYVDSKGEEISTCPRCGSYNQKKKAESASVKV